MEQAKRIPYGVSDFVDIIERNQYYVDKTMYLPMLEDEADCLFFIRPRRFGKSLFISMMRAYYDQLMKPRFGELFGHLWIGAHPTPEQGKYQVLYFDFSRIGGNIDELERNFNSYCNLCLNNFIDKYKACYAPEFVEMVHVLPRAVEKLNAINIEARDRGYRLYLIVDEYDNFTNVVLNEHGEKVYWALTHASGFYREVFKVFKGMFARIFMTGVSPVTLDDLTSGFNIGWHISTKAAFNQMLGFSTEDVYAMIDYYKQSGKIRPDADADAIVADMKPWYDNYCFSEDALNTQSRVFNSDMVLYYLRNYMSDGRPPRQMLDPNTKTDFNKIEKLMELGGRHENVLMTIAECGEIVSGIEESFPAEILTDQNVFISLLYYYGMLTIKGTRGAELRLGIPNNNVREQYRQYMSKLYSDKSPVAGGRGADTPLRRRPTSAGPAAGHHAAQDNNAV